MKKTTRILLFMAVLFAAVALSGKEAKASRITCVTVNRFDMPLDGATAKTDDDVTIKLHYEDEPVKATAEWTQHGQPITTFKAGETYEFSIVSENITIDDEIDPEYTIDIGWQYDDGISLGTYKKIYIDGFYTVKKTIPKVTVNYTAPKVGEVIKAPTVPKGANYEVYSFSWYKWKDGTFDTIWAEDVKSGKYTFEKDCYYCLSNVQVVANPEYCFDTRAIEYTDNYPIYKADSGYLDIKYLDVSEDAIQEGWTSLEGKIAYLNTRCFINTLPLEYSGKSSYTYTGKAFKPSAGITGLTAGKDYTVSYANTTKVGKATVTISGINEFCGSFVKTFTIKPKTAAVASAKPGSRKLTVKMKTKASATGGSSYQIGYKVKGTAKWKYKNTTKQSLAINKLKKGKRYQVRVRAYKTVSGQKYYGAWSKTVTSKKVK